MKMAKSSNGGSMAYLQAGYSALSRQHGAKKKRKLYKQLQ
jgi:hypothetical protein